MLRKLQSGLTVLVILALSGMNPALAGYPTQGNISPNDQLLGKPIPPSVGAELTIVSWNVRNLGAYNRSIKDYNAMIDLVEDADIVILQEVGLGLLRSPALTDQQRLTLESVRTLWQIRLGNEWQVTLADEGSGSGAGRETSMVAYRKGIDKKTIVVSWEGFYELGDSRDMAQWRIDLSNGTSIVAGSVHLTPDDPARGREMIRLAEWLVARQKDTAMVMGDMNWGYQRKSGVENYLGEMRVADLDAQGELFQVFREISYLGKGKADALRTNLGFRSGAFFYDQFLLSPLLSAKLSHGGILLKDAGMIAFGVHNKYMSDTIARSENSRAYGLSRYKRYDGEAISQDNFDKAMKDVNQQSGNDATWAISDHRPIWLKLNVW